ncbi:arsenate reductase [Thalassospira sp. MCCC 1A03138]|nr:arsenate reductase [Thalassospira sp. MCCC 1A03138]
MMVRIYHNPRCSKSRQTLALIEEQRITPDVIQYLDTPPTPQELKEILGMLGMAPEDILRKKEAKEEGIGDLRGDTLIEALCAHPRAIERPIVVNDHKATIGRPPESVLEIL